MFCSGTNNGNHIDHRPCAVECAWNLFIGLLRGTTLGKTIKKYTFFRYEVSEALHLSEDERNIMTDCLKIIRMELERGVDKHSKTLLVNYIELLLNYCMRFYERQFATRSHSNRDVLTRFEGLLDDYFEGELAERDGLPTVKYFADKLCLSSNYFGDMFKKETGKTPQEYIQEKCDRTGQKGTDVRQERNRQQGSLFTGISISAAFLPVVQEACGLYTE